MPLPRCFFAAATLFFFIFFALMARHATLFAADFRCLRFISAADVPMMPPFITPPHYRPALAQVEAPARFLRPLVAMLCFCRRHFRAAFAAAASAMPAKPMLSAPAFFA
jgi:hypothetical protein